MKDASDQRQWSSAGGVYEDALLKMVCKMCV